MKTIPILLAAHMAAECTTLATIWRVERMDGVLFFFTDCDIDIVFNGHTYLAGTGYTPSASETSMELNPDTMETKGILDSSTITDEDLTARKWDFAKIDCGSVSWKNPEHGVNWLRTGRLGEVKTGRKHFTAELRGLMQHLQQKVGRLYMPTCEANFGDSRCGKDLASYTFSGTVASVITRGSFTTSLSGHANGRFKSGKLTWLTGLNAGLSMEIRGYLSAGGSLDLHEKMAYAVGAGDTFKAHYGCDKLASTCSAVYNNIKSHRGFPLLPGATLYLTGKGV